MPHCGISLVAAGAPGGKGPQMQAPKVYGAQSARTPEVYFGGPNNPRE